MGRSGEDLAQRVWPDNLQHLQDTFSCCLGVPILFVDPSGRPLTACEDLSEFCRRFTRAISLSRPCLECDRAPRLSHPASSTVTASRARSLVHECPLGLVDVAAPVVAAGEHLGYVVSAQQVEVGRRGEPAPPARPRSDDECLALLLRLPRCTREELGKTAAGVAVLAWLLSALTGCRRRNLRLAERIREQSHWIQEQTMTDAVTGVANRRRFCAALEAETLRVRRYRRNLAVAVLDIQGFRRINDDFGHDIGDAVLREVAHCLLSTVRQTDLVGRVGGDEFALLFPETSRPEAMIALSRIARQIEDLNASGELPVEIRLLIGLADQSTGPERLLEEAYEGVGRGLSDPTP